MKLTDYFIKKRVLALLKKTAERKRKSCSWEEAEHIWVIYEAEDQEQIQSFLEQLGKQKKKVQTCVFVAEKKRPEFPDSVRVIHASSDLNLFNIPSDELLKSFIEQKTDVLIDLTHSQNYPMKYLMLQHPCSYKVGIKDSEVDLYDLSISVELRDDLKQICKHILFYLEAIRSK